MSTESLVPWRLYHVDVSYTLHTNHITTRKDAGKFHDGNSGQTLNPEPSTLPPPIHYPHNDTHQQYIHRHHLPSPALTTHHHTSYPQHPAAKKCKLTCWNDNECSKTNNDNTSTHRWTQVEAQKQWQQAKVSSAHSPLSFLSYRIHVPHHWWWHGNWTMNNNQKSSFIIVIYFRNYSKHICPLFVPGETQDNDPTQQWPHMQQWLYPMPSNETMCNTCKWAPIAHKWQSRHTSNNPCPRTSTPYPPTIYNTTEWASPPTNAKPGPQTTTQANK